MNWMSTFYLCHSENLIFLISPSSPPRKRNLSSSAGRSAVDRKEQWTNSLTEWECLSDTSAHAALSIYHWLTVSFTFTVWLDPKYNDPVMMWHWAINQIKSFGECVELSKRSRRRSCTCLHVSPHIICFRSYSIKATGFGPSRPSTTFNEFCFPPAVFSARWKMTYKGGKHVPLT